VTSVDPTPLVNKVEAVSNTLRVAFEDSKQTASLGWKNNFSVIRYKLRTAHRNEDKVTVRQAVENFYKENQGGFEKALSQAILAEYQVLPAKRGQRVNAINAIIAESDSVARVSEVLDRSFGPIIVFTTD